MTFHSQVIIYIIVFHKSYMTDYFLWHRNSTSLTKPMLSNTFLHKLHKIMADATPSLQPNLNILSQRSNAIGLLTFHFGLCSCTNIDCPFISTFIFSLLCLSAPEFSCFFFFSLLFLPHLQSESLTDKHAHTQWVTKLSQLLCNGFDQ